MSAVGQQQTLVSTVRHQTILAYFVHNVAPVNDEMKHILMTLIC